MAAKTIPVLARDRRPWSRVPTPLRTCLVALALVACTPVIENRGHKIATDDIEKIALGTGYEDVRALLGSPSTIAVIDDPVWFYISSKIRKYMFYLPEETERTIVAIVFDNEQKVREIARYGLEDGQIVNFVDRITPTSGKRLSVLGEIFGNLGRFNRPVQNSGP